VKTKEKKMKNRNFPSFFSSVVSKFFSDFSNFFPPLKKKLHNKQTSVLERHKNLCISIICCNNNNREEKEYEQQRYYHHHHRRRHYLSLEEEEEDLVR
jgi:hypothetical protein|tara:strand:- start:331 stop:624 length:294 start_codon:yes stop_codon:yes gene_type:complete